MRQIQASRYAAKNAKHQPDVSLNIRHVRNRSGRTGIITEFWQSLQEHKATMPGAFSLSNTKAKPTPFRRVLCFESLSLEPDCSQLLRECVNHTPCGQDFPTTNGRRARLHLL